LSKLRAEFNVTAATAEEEGRAGRQLEVIGDNDGEDAAQEEEELDLNEIFDGDF